MKNINKKILSFFAVLLFLLPQLPALSAQVSNVVLESNITGLELRTQQNDINAAFNTLHKGASLPASAAAGTLWIDDSGGATAWLLKSYDGTDSITLGTINTSANTFTPAGQQATLGNAVVNKTGTHTLDSTHFGQLIKCDATSASFTSNISATSGLGTSWYVIIQKTDATANTITVDPNSTEQVNGASTYILKNQFEGVFLIKDGSGLRALPFGNTNIVKVSSDDTTPGYIEDKITAGNGISLATANGGANETRSISTNLATDPGLEYSSTALRIKAGTGIVRNSSGINVDVGTTANKIVQLNGSAQLPAIDGSLLTGIQNISNRQTFTGSGTWTKPAGYSSTAMVLLEAWGAGGGGSSDSNTTPGDGSSGGSSSIGSLLTAYGGSGGKFSINGGFGGGIASTATVGQSSDIFEGVGAGANSSFTGALLTPSTGTITFKNKNGYFIGGGGGFSGSDSAGGNSIYGGGGGGAYPSGAGGISQYGGNGGAAANAGSAPGGGGGGRNTTISSAGGGGGSYKFRFIPLSAMGSTETITIGAGGAAATGGGAGARGEVRITIF